MKYQIDKKTRASFNKIKRKVTNNQAINSRLLICFIKTIKTVKRNYIGFIKQQLSL